MSATIATAVCAAFIAWLFFGSEGKGYKPSTALWIPIAWMFLAGSRFVSSWLGMAPTLDTWSSYAEGSPIDRAAFLALIVAGAIVLARRKIAWGRLLADNKWIWLYLLYCLASAAWSDEPFVLFKRWIKDLGHPIMVLVILTERRPYDALAVALRRLAFLLIPVSVLFVKYFPELGRQYRTDGTLMYVGVGNQKNDLGLLCLTVGLYLTWEILRKGERVGEPALSRIKLALIASMAAWLLYLSDSQTSMVCLVIGLAVLYVFTRSGPARHPYAVMAAGVLAGLAAWGLEETFNLRATLLEALGRNATLTNRTEIWQIVRAFEVDPWFGSGFMSFWTGQRLEDMLKLIGATINQAHNGYLEQYLNLGYVGVAFILLIVSSAVLKIARQFPSERTTAAFRLCLVVVALVYNYTEASFYGMNNMWILLLIACMDVSSQARASERVAQHDGRQPRARTVRRRIESLG